MTTAEALDKIPEIVEKAIPLNPPFEIQCAAKRSLWMENAKWRREQLKMRLTNLILMHKPQGLSASIDLDKLMKDTQ